MKILFALMLLTLSCSDSSTPTVARTPDTADSGGKPSLTLSWRPSPSVSAYHIFYIDAKKKTREIDAVLPDDKTFSVGTLTINESNMEVWPKAGEKACFYVVAALAGIKSDPSAQACLTLE